MAQKRWAAPAVATQGGPVASTLWNGDKLHQAGRPNQRQHLPDPSLERLSAHLIALGPRPLAEYLAELRTVYGRGIEDMAASYRRLDPGIVRAIGGDAFPSRMFMVDGGRQ